MAKDGDDARASASTPSVFVSYASLDSAIAETACEALEKAGVSCWIAPRDLTPGAFYGDEIVHAIDAAKATVLILSQNAATSPHVLREVERAASKRRAVISLRVDRAPIPAGLEYFLNTSQWLDASSGDMVRALPKLAAAVQVAIQASTATPTSVPTAHALSPPVPARSPKRSVPRQMVGRARELDIFRAAFTRLLDGRRQVVLISGEPGIGKTRCAEAIADLAEDQGALVLWGRCREEAGAPPYWPWVQILRAYVDASSLDEVRLSLGAAANDVAALMPELVETPQRTLAAPGTIGDANAARFRAFDAIGQFLRKTTQQVPLALVLDNLHWADGPSLSLFEFLAQELTHSRLLLVGTYRDADIEKQSPLRSTLGGLTRESEVERVHLSGLSEAAIGAVAANMCNARALPESVIRTIYQRTDGNPLFAMELIKVLIEDSAGAAITAVPAKIPAGVRETIARRLVSLPASCIDLLEIAAVFGRQFAAGGIAVATEATLEAVLSGLEPAVQSGLLDASAEVAGDYQFTHALIRETIYEDIATSLRLRMHGRAGDALVSVYSAHPEPVLTHIAYHYHLAAVLGAPDKALAYGLRAADQAVLLSAFEDALVHYDRAIETLERCGIVNDERLVHTYILKATALKELGHIKRSTDVVLKAVDLSRALGNHPELLVDALELLAFLTRHVGQEHLIPLVEHALTLLPPEDSAARAKALSIRAFSCRTLTDKAQLQLHVDEALQMARRICGAAARCACCQFAVMALRGNPETLKRRLEVGDEYIAVARATGSADLLADAYHWQALNHLECGQLEELEALLEHYASLGAARYGLHQYHIGAYRVIVALLRGEWADLEGRIRELLELGTKTRRGDADGVYGAQMFALQRDLGCLPALALQIKQVAATLGKRVWQPGLMLMCAETGMLEEARRMFGEIAKQGFSGVCRDDMYVTCLVFCAETCCALADAERAVMLYELLRPYAGQTANHPTAVCLGAADLYLAMLAAVANRHDSALEHFDRAISFNRAMRAWPWLARSLFRHGAFLLAGRTEAERVRGRQQLREAEQLARRLGMARLIDEIDGVLHVTSADRTFPDDLTAREVEVLRLIAMGRTNKDVSRVLSISLNTVATHVRSILNKTQCANRTETASYAIRHGLQAAESAPTTVSSEVDSHGAIHD
jgi:DNA-binding CsgD family transcriptional regulator/tetratricopeptide (TPR) repeat protein